MELKLLHGCILIYDAADSAIVDAHKWYAKKHRYTWYAVSTDHPQVKLHRILLGAAPGELVDHVNGNGLDNRRQNIRKATAAENSRNQRQPCSNHTSQFKGVNYCPWRKVAKWVSRVSFNGRRIHLGYFETEEEAAQAYNHAAKMYHQEFARLNADAGLPEQFQKQMRSTKTSRFPGVYWNSRESCWQAQIKIRGHNKGLGVFKDEEDAFRAYTAAKLERTRLCLIG